MKTASVQWNIICPNCGAHDRTENGKIVERINRTPDGYHIRWIKCEYCGAYTRCLPPQRGFVFQPYILNVWLK